MIGERKTSVGIMGASMATRNRGVSALGSSLIKLLDEAAPNADTFMLIPNRVSTPFTVFVSGAPREIPVVNCRQSPKSKLAENIFVISILAFGYRILPLGVWRRSLCNACPWIRAVASARMVGDIRGGDSFSDIYGLRSFCLASIPTIAVILIRGKIVLFPQTYGPFKHRFSRMIAGFIMRHADPILSRDHDSIQTVRDLVGPIKEIQFCPDVAFVLDPISPEALSIAPPLPPERNFRLVGLNANGLMYNGGYTRQNMFGLKLDYKKFLAKLVDALLDDKTIRVLLVPHTFAPIGDVESDPEACRRVIETVSNSKRDRLHLVDREYDQHEIKSVIGMCDFFIGSRLHSCIAALSQGIPTVGVAYSKKFKGVFETVGAAEWVVDGRDTDAENAVIDVLSRMKQSSSMRETLAKETVRVRAQLRRTFSTIVA
jgi:colanic acid/amylovoran biosynthesis protein